MRLARIRSKAQSRITIALSLPGTNKRSIKICRPMSFHSLRSAFAPAISCSIPPRKRRPDGKVRRRLRHHRPRAPSAGSATIAESAGTAPRRAAIAVEIGASDRRRHHRGGLDRADYLRATEAVATGFALKLNNFRLPPPCGALPKKSIRVDYRGNLTQRRKGAKKHFVGCRLGKLVAVSVKISLLCVLRLGVSTLRQGDSWGRGNDPRFALSV